MCLPKSKAPILVWACSLRPASAHLKYIVRWTETCVRVALQVGVFSKVMVFSLLAPKMPSAQLP